MVTTTGTEILYGGRGQPPKYPWEAWFDLADLDGEVVVRRGVDYDCSQSSMAQSIRGNASKRGLRVRLTDLGDRFVIRLSDVRWQDRGRGREGYVDEVCHTAPTTIAD